MSIVKKIIQYLGKELCLFGIGGVIYMLIEILWRGRTHWTMGIVGGLCFVCIGLINEIFTYGMYIESQCIIGSIIVTFFEFISGYIINIKLRWNVWDYSNLPLNIMGQVCLLFSIFWVFLSFVGIYCDDWIRFKIWKEPFPHYIWWLKEKVFKEKKKR